MRHFKFRAWDKKSKEWLLGYEYPNLGGFSMFGEVMLLGEWSAVVSRFILSQKDRTPEDLDLMQFTGLKDKNGKEIYENDILSIPDRFESREHFVVQFEPEIGAYRCVADIFAFHLGGINTGDMEVVGNIHENEDLLES